MSLVVHLPLSSLSQRTCQCRRVSSLASCFAASLPVSSLLSNKCFRSRAKRSMGITPAITRITGSGKRMLINNFILGITCIVMNNQTYRPTFLKEFTKANIFLTVFTNVIQYTVNYAISLRHQRYSCLLYTSIVYKKILYKNNWMIYQKNWVKLK